MNIDRIEQFYKQFLNPSDIAFDIGANEGHWSEGFSRLCRKVIAVEPQSKVFERLSNRFRRSNVICLNEAVGSSRNEGVIRMPKDGSLGRSGVGSMSEQFIRKLGPEIFNLVNGWDDSQIVSITTLDILITEYGCPSFIKIDVEGYESNVLRGLSQRIPLSFEFNPVFMHPVQESFVLLEKLGYTEFNYDVLARFKFELPEWVSINKIKEEILCYEGRRDIFGDIYAR